MIKSLMQLIAFIGAVLVVQFLYMSHYEVGKKTEDVRMPSGCDRLVMYSASWCGACKLKREQLNQKNILFKEHFVDRDPNMNARFERKANQAGISIAYPRLEVNGILMENYPVAYLQKTYDLCMK